MTYFFTYLLILPNLFSFVGQVLLFIFSKLFVSKQDSPPSSKSLAFTFSVGCVFICLFVWVCVCVRVCVCPSFRNQGISPSREFNWKAKGRFRNWNETQLERVIKMSSRRMVWMSYNYIKIQRILFDFLWTNIGRFCYHENSINCGKQFKNVSN